MGLFDFLRKEDKAANVPDRPPRSRGLVDLSGYLGVFSPYTCSGNFIEAFETMGEVFFPVDFLASRIAGGNYQLKLAKDDSVVFNNEEMNRFFSDPNPLFSFEDLVKMFFVYKYVTGNGFWQASPSVRGIKPKELWKWCDTYWVLPSDQVVINSPMSIPLFQPSTKEDIINSYRISTNSGLMDIDPSLVIHYKDINMRLNSSYLKGRSRLETQRYPIANLVAVYEARNVIYVKRGALGLLISKKYDADGSLPLTDKEKRNIRKEWNDNYGLTNDRSQMSIVDVPTEFVRINMSIQELMPFEETLADAIQIAGIYGIPSALIPRKDMAKYDNQDIAEVGMSGSAEMRMAEPDDTAVLMLIAGTIFIGTRLILAIHVMRDRVRVRAQLDQSERHASPRKRMSHPVCPDNRIHQCCLILGGQVPKDQQS